MGICVCNDHSKVRRRGGESFPGNGPADRRYVQGAPAKRRQARSLVEMMLSVRHVLLAEDERAWGPRPRRSARKTVKCYSFV